MANLTEDRRTKQMAGDAALFVDPVAAATTIYAGAMAALDASGDAVPAAPASAKMRGVARAKADNASGNAGDKSVTLAKGTFLFAQTGLDRSNIESDVFVVDDQTVGATGTLIAGKLVALDAAGAWVEIR